jgi:hypothetical protein
VSHGRYVALQIAEVAIRRQMFQDISAAHRGTAAAAATSTGVRIRWDASELSTDGRSVSECQEKRSDQNHERRLGGLE